jgi:putative transposase
MKTTHVKWAFKYRFHPTVARAQERVNYDQTSTMLTAWKKTEELACLNDVSSVPLQQALRHLQTAFTNFFGKRAKHPRSKSRKTSRTSADYTTSAFRFRPGKLTLVKMTEPLEIVWSRPLPEGASPSPVTVSQDAAVGIDVGLGHLLTLSTGEKVSHPRYERCDRTRLAQAQRQVARKAKGDGVDGAEARRKVAKVYARNQSIVIEDLAVRNMVKNGSLARAISDAAWSEFRSMLAYRVHWYGREVIAIDRWFPSSKLRSACGTVQDKMPLNVREWTCGGGTIHDRDLSAAKNILAVGLTPSVRGAGGRPQRSTPGGQSATLSTCPSQPAIADAVDSAWSSVRVKWSPGSSSRSWGLGQEARHRCSSVQPETGAPAPASSAGTLTVLGVKPVSSLR